MKVAIVCDDLIQFGGAERVVVALSELYPEAPIYTSYVSKAWRKIFDARGVKVVSSFMQKLPFVDKLYRIYSVFFLHVFAFESFNLGDFDLVISSSSRYAHFVLTPPKTMHICYMHSPGRMFWEPASYFENEKVAKFLLFIPLCMLRMLDYSASQRVDYFISNSQTSLDRIHKYYRRKGTIVHPFYSFSCENSVSENTSSAEKYFVVITRLLAWKKVELAMGACESLGLKLKVIGRGPDMHRLRKLAGKNTELLGYVTEQQKIKLLAGAEALIVTQKEDFGIVSLEAMSLGTPVIAYAAGGALETVKEGKTGEFFREQTPESLVEVLKVFNKANYKKEDCKNVASDFSKEAFFKNFHKTVDSVYLKN